MDHSCSQSAPFPNLEQSELSLAGPTADAKPGRHTQPASKVTKPACSRGRPRDAAHTAEGGDSFAAFFQKDDLRSADDRRGDRTRIIETGAHGAVSFSE